MAEFMLQAMLQKFEQLLLSNSDDDKIDRTYNDTFLGKNIEFVVEEWDKLRNVQLLKSPDDRASFSLNASYRRVPVTIKVGLESNKSLKVEGSINLFVVNHMLLLHQSPCLVPCITFVKCTGFAQKLVEINDAPLSTSILSEFQDLQDRAPVPSDPKEEKGLVQDVLVLERPASSKDLAWFITHQMADESQLVPLLYMLLFTTVVFAKYRLAHNDMNLVNIMVRQSGPESQGKYAKFVSYETAYVPIDRIPLVCNYAKATIDITGFPKAKPQDVVGFEKAKDFSELLGNIHFAMEQLEVSRFMFGQFYERVHDKLNLHTIMMDPYFAALKQQPRLQDVMAAYNAPSEQDAGAFFTDLIPHLQEEETR